MLGQFRFEEGPTFGRMEPYVVRSIFRAYAARYGTKAIAHALNGDPAGQDLCARYFGGQTGWLRSLPPAKPLRRSWRRSHGGKSS